MIPFDDKTALPYTTVRWLWNRSIIMKICDDYKTTTNIG
jgi:hypothetical protein